MKRLIFQTAIALGLLVGGSACRKTTDGVPPIMEPPVVVTVPKDTIRPGLPLITDFAIEGLPKEAISIDQATKRITVVVPEVPVLVESAVSATVTPGYTLFPTGTPNPKFNLFYTYPKTFPLYDAKNQQVASYTITLIQTRPLEITAAQPLTLATGSPLTIPVKNFYEDNSGAIAVLTNTQTGQILRGQLEGSVNFRNPVYVPNQAVAFFDSDVLQGDYTLDIVKSSGRTARSPQPVTIRRGLPTAYPDYWYPFNTYSGGQGIRVRGTNLYAEDQIEFLLTSRAGDRYKVTPMAYAPDGKSLTLDLPADLKPVPYSVQMIRKGELVAAYARLVVRKDINQPALVDFGDASLMVAPAQPVTLRRGKLQTFNMIYSPGIAKVRLRFTSVANSANDYLVDASHTEGYLGFGPDAGYPTFTLPTAMLPGRYTIRLQHILRTDSQVVEGEPMERDIDVQ